jgi:hypothetical protein
MMSALLRKFSFAISGDEHDEEEELFWSFIFVRDYLRPMDDV